jgi:membrane protein implicated in regulation of membrane protease activity
MGLLEHLQYWHWLLAGMVLLILEVFSPGVFFLWLGIAAGLTGLVLWLVPALSWEWQVVLFAGFSLLAVAAGRAWFRGHPGGSERPLLNRRGEQYVGRVFTLEQPIVNGAGKVRVDDSTWKVRGTDCPAGTRVRVVAVDGTVLEVELA